MNGGYRAAGCVRGTADVRYRASVTDSAAWCGAGTRHAGTRRPATGRLRAAQTTSNRTRANLGLLGACVAGGASGCLCVVLACGFTAVAREGKNE